VPLAGVVAELKDMIEQSNNATSEKESLSA
jgi:hypothetical protein